MGAEIGQGREWNCTGEIEWWLLQYPHHAQVQLMVKELNHLYKTTKSLWEDFNHSGFEWIDFADHSNSVISYLRKAGPSTVLCVHNFTPNYYPHYHIKLGHCTEIVEIFNSDDVKYGGSGKINKTAHIDHGIHITLAPLATMIFEF